MNFKHLEHTKDQFIKVANSQERKGIEKYNQPLDPLEPGRNWLDMEFEEMVDGTKYNRAMRVRIAFVVEQIKKRTDDVEILHYLEFLEGKV